MTSTFTLLHLNKDACPAEVATLSIFLGIDLAGLFFVLLLLGGFCIQQFNSTSGNKQWHDIKCKELET